jgi:anti-sigma factor RsiW
MWLNTRREHAINVFVWPQSSGWASHAVRSDPRGYHVISWTRDGMAVWVVSDLAPAELNEFADRLDTAVSKK